jgi:hypothetical protein
MRCVRCRHVRWPTLPLSEPYVCRRCLAVLAGRNAIDPLASPERAAHMAKIRPRNALPTGEKAPNPAEPMS